MKILLHLGFPKTMSSSFQFGLFKPLHEKGIVNLKTWRQINEKEHLDNRPSSRLFKGENILDSYLDFKANILNILSDESFTAPYKLRKNNYGNNIKNPLFFPDEIKKQIIAKYGNEVEIIPFIVLRNQCDLIYSQYVEEYNLKKYKNIDLLFNEKGEIDLNGFEIYKFYKYISNLDKKFGKNKIKILLFENWINSFDLSCRELSKILNLEFEVIKNLLSNSHVNKKKKSPKGYYTKDGSDIIPFLSNEDKRKIKDYYREDNKKLMNYLVKDSDLIGQRYL